MIRIRLIISIFFLFSLTFTALQAQNLDGIYRDGDIYLYLEEQTDGIVGKFIDVNEAEYEVKLTFGEDGLFGYCGILNAYIPYDSEQMILYVAPMDANNQPLWDDAYVYNLEFVSELNGNTQTPTTGYSWNPIHRFGTDFYPSYVIATSTMTNEVQYEPANSQYSYYGDANGFFGITISGLPAGTHVGVVIGGDPYIKPSSYEAITNQVGTSEIYPIMEYDYIGLKNLTQALPLNLKYDLYINGEFQASKIEVVWTRSINDAVTSAIDHHGTQFSFPFIFAAYVNENEPSLDPILGEILDEGIVDSWIGYQGSQDQVMEQIFALWYHFQRKGFRYSSITTQSGSDSQSFGQTVRFIEDALTSSQANCIDGTVLFASFLYKIGIDVSIVLVPGHAYLAFRPNKDEDYKIALETTMMGHLNLKHSAKQEELFGVMEGHDENVVNSWNSFLGAINQGTENYISNALPGIQQNDPMYLELNIREERQRKVRPIK